MTDGHLSTMRYEMGNRAWDAAKRESGGIGRDTETERRHGVHIAKNVIHSRAVAAKRRALAREWLSSVGPYALVIPQGRIRDVAEGMENGLPRVVSDEVLSRIGVDLR